MATAHVATPSSLQAELSQFEDQEEQLLAELAQAQDEVNQVRQAGDAVLRAVEAAMSPLMEDLAITRRNCGLHLDLGSLLAAEPGGEDTSAAGLQAEIVKLQADIAKAQDLVHHLEAEEKVRKTEAQQLRDGIAEATESLSYERERLKHHEVKQLGTDASGIALGGGKVQQVRAEIKMRESAEQRAGRLSRDVTKLAVDMARNQAMIEQQQRRLNKLRKVANLKEGTSSSADLARSPGSAKRMKQQRAQAASMRSGSTGRLPQLSF